MPDFFKCYVKPNFIFGFKLIICLRWWRIRNRNELNGFLIEWFDQNNIQMIIENGFYMNFVDLESIDKKCERKMDKDFYRLLDESYNLWKLTAYIVNEFGNIWRMF